ncbi:hypothetical protein KBC40_00180 [Patescibacteria group bacterium]|nr:hypothetical protein [Patescibacteria group bacterium]
MKTIKAIFEIGDTVRIMDLDKYGQQNDFAAKACVQNVNPEGDRIIILITRTLNEYFRQDETYILRTWQGGNIWRTPFIDINKEEHYLSKAPGFCLEITEP